MSTIEKQIENFAGQYAQDHYEADNLHVGKPTRKEESGDVWYEIDVQWGKENKWTFTLYLKIIEERFVVHYVDGSVPVQIYTLVPSHIRGRYSLDNAADERDITTGQGIEIRLGDRWISGRVEYDADPLYVQLGLQYPGQKLVGPDAIGGYVFVSDDGGICGLCVGMKVKI